MKSFKPTLAIFATAFVLSIFSIAQLKLFRFSFAANFDAIVEAAKGVATGYPHWRLFQNRVLGPWIFSILYDQGLDETKAYIITTAGLLLGFYTAFTFCAWNLTRNPKAVFVGLLTCFSLNAILLQPPWIYLWDFIDLTVFTFFAWAVIRHARLWVFLALIGVELINREVAVILALLLGIDGIATYLISKSKRALNQGIAGIVAVAFGIWFTETLRDALLVKEMGPIYFPAVESGRNVNLQLFRNFAAFSQRR